MRSFLRAAALPLALLGFGFLACVVEERRGRDGGEVPDPATVQIRRRELDQQMAAVKARSEARLRLIGELIEGRLRLTDVVDEFMKLNREYPAVVSEIRIMYPADDERQSTTRHVLTLTESELQERRDLTPEQRRRVLERLEAELREGCGESSPDAPPK